MTKQRISKFFGLFAILLTGIVLAAAQDKNKTEPGEKTAEDQTDEILVVKTELIQTGVGVFDKNGKFVDGLDQDDFELRVDGKPVTISFFEKFRGGENKSTNRKESNRASVSIAPEISSSAPLGRTFIFVADDFHLSFPSQKRTRDLINGFIEKEMLPNDYVAIVSTSGKIGFLQQFTNDPMVLRMAAERIKNARLYSGADRSHPPMSEYEALSIDRWDREITDIFVKLLAREMPGTAYDILVSHVQSRARTILFQTAQANLSTFSILEQAIRNSGQLPGRKVVFFISDGFLLDQSNTDASFYLRKITDAAARTNTVIYSFDAKGLEAGMPESTSAGDIMSSAGFRVQSGERFELQDALSDLANSTGGKFFRYTNDLKGRLSDAISEVSAYYLLAWDPEFDSEKSDKLKRIEVIVRNRPELRVRMQTGLIDEAPKSASSKAKKSPKQKDLPVAETELKNALFKPVPAQELPTFLSANYIDVPDKGGFLSIYTQIKYDFADFETDGKTAIAKYDLLGLIYDSEGRKAGGFSKILTVSQNAASLNEENLPQLFYNHQLQLKPGLYQIRIAARGNKSARTGSAAQWILIPDLASGQLAMSSLIIGEFAPVGVKTDSASIELTDVLKSGISVDRKFARSSKLRYLGVLYNSAKSSETSQIYIQTQIFRGEKLEASSSTSPASSGEIDSTRIHFAAEIPLENFDVGRYLLVVKVEDRAAKTTVERRVSFEIY